MKALRWLALALALSAYALLFVLMALVPSPAHAAVLGVVDTPAGRIELHDEAGPCKGEARRVEFLPPKGDAIPGCWKPVGAMLAVVFFDTDIASIPLAAVRKPETL
jgi:hypothetical protein